MALFIVQSRVREQPEQMPLHSVAGVVGTTTVHHRTASWTSEGGDCPHGLSRPSASASAQILEALLSWYVARAS